MRFLICYDIPSDSTRDKVAKWLDGFGDRIQDSVFEAELEDDQVERMWTGVLDRVNAKLDRVIMAPLCAACHSRRRWIGSSDTEKWTAAAWVV